jgi:hypothetical protein
MPDGLKEYRLGIAAPKRVGSFKKAACPLSRSDTSARSGQAAVSNFNPPTKNQCTVTAKGRLMSFQLPPEITVSKDQIDVQWVFTFRHNELGNIGRIRLKGTGANTMINLDVIGPCTFP